jgi:signal transduction histidine kinase
VFRLIDTAPYQLSGNVDKNGVLWIQDMPEINVDLRPLSHNHFHLANSEIRLPSCGPFSVSLNIWDLEPTTGKGFGIDRTLREAIKSASGVSIYRDGFRIWPYGEKDDDWLELNQRRVNNPTLRISNNQIIGFIEITHKDNPDLRDRTSREGLLDTPAFFDLKALVLAVLSELETKRFVRRRQLTSVRSAPEAEDGDELLQRLIRARNDAGTHLKGQNIQMALQDIERMYRERLEQENSRYTQVSRLAGVGMAAELLTAAFSREISKTMTVLRTLQGEVHLDGSLRIQHLVEDLTTHMEVINEQLDMMEPLYSVSRQNNDLVDIRGVAYDTVSILTHHIVETGTQVSLIGNQRLTVRISRGHIMQVLMILFENALLTMKQTATDYPRIEIQVIAEKDFSGLLITDSGPGIPPAHHKLIFEPYFSSRKAGRGLGLHVARDILAGYNSNLNLVSDRSLLPGASFEIRFDGRRVVAQRQYI